MLSMTPQQLMNLAGVMPSQSRTQPQSYSNLLPRSAPLNATIPTGMANQSLTSPSVGSPRVSLPTNISGRMKASPALASVSGKPAPTTNSASATTAQPGSNMSQYVNSYTTAWPANPESDPGVQAALKALGITMQQAQQQYGNANTLVAAAAPDTTDMSSLLSQYGDQNPVSNAMNISAEQYAASHPSNTVSQADNPNAASVNALSRSWESQIPGVRLPGGTLASQGHDMPWLEATQFLQNHMNSPNFGSLYSDAQRLGPEAFLRQLYG